MQEANKFSFDAMVENASKIQLNRRIKLVSLFSMGLVLIFIIFGWKLVNIPLLAERKIECTVKKKTLTCPLLAKDLPEPIRYELRIEEKTIISNEFKIIGENTIIKFPNEIPSDSKLSVWLIYKEFKLSQIFSITD